jgi:hypothetical protein
VHLLKKRRVFPRGEKFLVRELGQIDLTLGAIGIADKNPILWQSLYRSRMKHD